MSHITVLKSEITCIDSIKDFVESLGLQLIKDGNVRFWAGQIHKADYVIRCNGKYDIGLNWNEKEQKFDLAADWSYGDFKTHLDIGKNKNTAKFIEEGHNEFLFRRQIKKKYKVKDKNIKTQYDKTTGLKQLLVEID